MSFWWLRLLLDTHYDIVFRKRFDCKTSVVSCWCKKPLECICRADGKNESATRKRKNLSRIFYSIYTFIERGKVKAIRIQRTIWGGGLETAEPNRTRKICIFFYRLLLALQWREKLQFSVFLYSTESSLCQEKFECKFNVYINAFFFGVISPWPQINIGKIFHLYFESIFSIWMNLLLISLYSLLRVSFLLWDIVKNLSLCRR